MTPERWQRLRELFEQAEGLDDAGRAALIEKVRCESPDLAEELGRMLHDADGTATIDIPLVDLRGSPLCPGRVVLGRFRIVRLLGRGGMGEVYEAEDLELGRIALKTIAAHLGRDDAYLARFRREVQLARRITSPCVCRIHDLFVAPPAAGGAAAAFLTMEFLEGETLASRLSREGPLPIEDIGRYAADLCSALAAIHEAGIVHRDLKPQNVMLTRRKGRVSAVVMDLGLARETGVPNGLPLALAATAANDGGLTRPGAVLGTPEYMAPEQFQALPATPATDIYALGMILYEMATGARPFRSSNPFGAAMLRTRPPAPASETRNDLPGPWDIAISRCLLFDPALRFASAAEVAAEFRLAASSASAAPPETAIPPAPSGEPVARRLRSRFAGRRAAAAAAALAIAAAIPAAWYRSHAYHEPPAGARRWYDEGVGALREGAYLKASTALTRAVEIDPGFAVAHARLADAWGELDFTTRAQTEILRASSLEARSGLPALDRMYVEAVRSTLTFDFPVAIRAYDALLAELPAADKPYGQLDVGRAREKAGDLPGALRAYGAAAALAPEFPAAFVRIGILRNRQGKAREGEEAFARAEDLYRAASNAEGLAEVAYQRGYAAGLRGDAARARELLEQSIHAARDISSPQLEIRALTRLSTVEYMAGRGPEAVQAANRAIGIARERGLEYWAVDGLVRLGNAWLTSGDYAKAEPPVQEALRSARENRWPRLEAGATMTLASIRGLSHNPRESSSLAQAALGYYDRAGFLTESTSALSLIVRSLSDLGDYAEALPRALRLVEVAGKLDNPVLTELSEETAGGVLNSLERYPEALRHYENALKAARETGQSVEYQALHCASQLTSLGRFEEAERMLATIPGDVAKNPRIRTIVDQIRANMHLIRRDFRGVSEIAAASFARKDISASALTRMRTTLGLSLAESGAGKQAVTLCRTALDSATKAASPGLTLEARICLANALFSTREWTEAASVAESARRHAADAGELESGWRVDWVLARIHKSSGDTARAKNISIEGLDILSRLEHDWESSAVERYEARPDARAARGYLNSQR